MTTNTTAQTRPFSNHMAAALSLPRGSRFFRCALHVNPFAYLKRHNKPTRFTSEEEYNNAIIKTCIDIGIEVIAVTDHYRVAHSANLVHAARAAGLHAFNGFEAITKDGVHFLCLFDPDKDEVLERFIGECGIHNPRQLSPTGSKDSTELLEYAKKWKAVCIAVHVASDGGLLKKLSGQSRVNVWTNPDLLACALPGPATAAPDGIRQIIENTNAEHKRDHPLAILNASDVSDPDKLKDNAASCFLKMSTVSIEAFRQAFLDPVSRIRLHSDPDPDPHAEFIAMTWEGGFLHDTAVHFNGNLNVLVGGRGTGKSTMIESIRYALGLDPLGEEARKTHASVIKNVLRSGTKVTLRVRSHKPSDRHYTIERSVPNPPIVKDDTGKVLNLSPSDVMPGVEIFGQHEISELAKSPEKRTFLLERFVDRDPTLSTRKSKVRLELEQARGRIMNVRREMARLDEQLSALPVLEETQARFRQAGLEERLQERSRLIREERLFLTLEERIDQYRTLHEALAESLPVDSVFVSSKAVKGLPNSDVLSQIAKMLATLSGKLKILSEQFGEALAEADRSIIDTKSRWKERTTTIEETYEKILRELQKSKIDGAEFIQLRQQIEELRPLTDRMKNLKHDLELHNTQRQNLLAEWKDVKAFEYRQLETAANRVSRKLHGRVQVNVTMADDRNPLEKLLREIGGNLSAAIDRLQKLDHLSLPELAELCREGKEALQTRYQLPSGAAERIAQADPELFMCIEELELPSTTEIKLNTAPEGQPANWQTLQELSTGQMATAVLLLLLLESDAPLVIDQPEDDLDNRFITEGVVPIMRQEKRRRQFIFSTHNANIPVLGDAELILGLAAVGIAKEGQARITPQHMASIDSQPVRNLVEEILEGGKTAFEMRRSKYGF